MSCSDMIILIMELIGTVAFASSGAMTGIQKKMDLFGVNVLGITTAVGGGLVRDLILGKNPPAMFLDSKYALTAIFTSTFLFFVVYFRQKLVPEKISLFLDKLLLIGDTIGLGIFTVMGCHAAVLAGYEENRFLILFVGVLTGVGGGMIRDVMAGNTPYILIKHIYAVASLAGACVFVLCQAHFGRIGCLVGGASVVIVIRFLAAHYRWNLPRIL